jgi:hypothetical protein
MQTWCYIAVNFLSCNAVSGDEFATRFKANSGDKEALMSDRFLSHRSIQVLGSF